MNGYKIGRVVTEWLPDGRRMKLIEDFAVVIDGIEWYAPAGTLIDGSSIPRMLWDELGGPFTGLHREASVIHDRYCVTKERPHVDTHKMYRDVCILCGMGKFMAGVLYTGLAAFGPKWGDDGAAKFVSEPDNVSAKFDFREQLAVARGRDERGTMA